MRIKQLFFRKLIIFLTLFNLICVPAHANCIKPVYECRLKPCCCVLPVNHWYLDTNVGRSFDYARNNITFSANNSPPVYVQLINQGKAPNANFFSIGAGYTWAKKTDYFPFVSAGLQYRYTVPTTVNVTLPNITFPEAQPNASYKLGQQSYILLGKIDIYRWDFVMPYISLGLGTTLNRISQFAGAIPNTPISLFALKKTTSNINYNLGVGIDLPIKKDFWVTFGYSYDYFGKSGEDIFVPILGPDVLIKLTNKNLHAQNIQLGVRYLFA